MFLKGRFAALLIIGVLLSSGTSSKAQTPPAPIPDSGSFGTRPLVPAVGEATRLSIQGAFAFSNATVSLQQQEVVPELVTIDLVTEWSGGVQEPVDFTPTSWSTEVELGELAELTYDLLVRVNGEVFLFTYFMVEAARPEPAALPQPAPNVVPQRPLGINLAFVKDYSQMFNFVDVFKVSRPWISHRPSDDTWDTGTAFDLDELGWVRSLQPDQEAGALMLTGRRLSGRALHRALRRRGRVAL